MVSPAQSTSSWQVRKRKWDNCTAGEQLFGLVVTRFPELEQTENEVCSTESQVLPPSLNLKPRATGFVAGATPLRVPAAQLAHLHPSFTP